MSKVKHNKSRRTPQRSATRGRQVARPARVARRPEDQELVQALRAAMRAGSLATAALVSGMIESATSSEVDQRVALPRLVESFIGVPIAEATAALQIMAALVPDELLRAQIRRELAGRWHPMPMDVAEFANVRVVRTVEMRLSLDVDEDVILELQGPGVRDVCLLVYLDHQNETTLVKNAFLMPNNLNDTIAQVSEFAQREGFSPVFPELGLADARARLEEAIPAYDTREQGLTPGKTWRGLRPLLRFVVSTLPEGGTAYPAGDEPRGIWRGLRRPRRVRGHVLGGRAR